MDNFTNSTGLGYFWQRIKSIFATKIEVNTALGQKVDKIDGKGLSTNDYTTSEKTKLAGIETGAQVNTIENVQVNGLTQTITTKAVNIAVPTTTSQLTNNSGFQTASQVQTLINNAIAEVGGFDIVKVTELPLVGAKGTIYLLPKVSPGQDNIFEEWIYLEGVGWEMIGTTAIDLSGFWSKAELIPVTTAEIDAITV